ncbi:hypothetical protein GG681_02920 [Epibacterium sp. SM1969]|uniref:Uncharacterized protein n=1 Tax=Tritonibacter aquimaris TaxID=2663379 RepID=A0A844AKF0_9RHOB|nr:hypothetical protein [Tritonibacter aquimaris]MQY41579.1 hypothetical protein [Tritonibacter aquimaris]
MDWRWVVLGLLVALGAAIALEVYLKRNHHRNLSASRPEKPVRPLGMEATDVKQVEEAHASNRAHQKRNDALSRR